MSVIASSDLAAILPERLVNSCGHRLCARPVPFQVAPLELFLVFHPRASHDRRQRWVRETLTAAARRKA